MPYCYYNALLEFDGDILLCPNCGADYLHHSAVEILNRAGEGEDCDGTRVAVQGEQITVRPAERKEFPSRRDALRIRFWCEGCQRTSVLEVQQHKGQTLMGWSMYGLTIEETSE